ncbi:hypothetical protein DFH28DRAFT_1085134 [Melampsora americana]|nr:hypothetical protein DFH28DRAFT_1085134 [Melampsora americana]
MQGSTGGNLNEDEENPQHRDASNDLLTQIPVDQIALTAPPPPPPILFPFADEEEITEALAQFVFEAQEAAFQRQRRFRIALSGEYLSQILGAGIVTDDRMQWEHWEVFFVDEALVSIHSPDSTYCQFKEAILKHVPIPIEQVHTINRLTEDQIEEAVKTVDGSDRMTDELADIYEQDLLKVFPEADMEAEDESELIKPKFDLILLQLGQDGHIGSLLPNHPLLGESNWYVAWLGDSPIKPSHRITFTLPLLNSAHQIALIVIGEDKSIVLADALNRSIESDVPMEEDRINPAALLKTDKRPIVWFVDHQAVQITNYPQSKFWDEEEEEIEEVS